jgi:uncharacterized repeat protein (TIGR01451 family)
MWQRIILFIGLTFIFASFCIIAVAQSNDVEWLDSEEYTLYWGDEVNHSGYIITAVDFSPAKATDDENDYVFLTVDSVYGDSWGAILANNTAMIGNNTVFDERLNITSIEIITGNDIPSPYTTISVCISNSTGSLPTKVSWMDANFEFKTHVSDEVYIDERAYVTIEMDNLKDIAFEEVTIIQVLPEELVMDPDSDQFWNFSFNPYEKKIHDFSLKALKPGTYELPGPLVNAEYNGRVYSKQLNNSSLIIHGPYINLKKTVSSTSVNQNDVINVTLDVSNAGDRAAHVRVSDQLPLGSVLISGKNDLSRVLPAEENVSLEYSIRMEKTGDIVIPSAQADFVDSKEYEGTVYSRKQVIQVLGPGFVSDTTDSSGQVGNDNISQVEDGEYAANASDSALNTTETKEDHGKLQFLYDILDSIIEFLKNTKDKIL